MLLGTIVLLLAIVSCKNNITAPENELTTEQEEFLSRAHLSDDQVVKNLKNYFFEYLKVIQANGVTGYYIKMKPQGDLSEEKPNVSTNEAMGYGMRLALQGYQLAKTRGNKRFFRTIFEGLWRVQFKMSKNGLSHWLIYNDLTLPTSVWDISSATDGQADIAYALVMAHEIFGSQSGIDNPSNYKIHAMRFISTFTSDFTNRALILGKTITYPNIGNSFKNSYVKKKDGKDVTLHTGRLTRPCDWMPHHYKTFKKFLEKEFSSQMHKTTWKQKITTLDELVVGVEYMLTKNPFGSGLFPDFIYFENTGTKGGFRYVALNKNIKDPWGQDTYRYLAEELGEEVETHLVSWNACRTPWRLAMDYNNSRRPAIRNALAKMGNKLHPGSLQNTGSEYTLDGVMTNSYFESAFAAPIATTSLPTRFEGSPWQAKQAAYNRISRDLVVLNNNWVGASNDGYFQDSINNFCQLILTGKQYVPYK